MQKFCFCFAYKVQDKDFTVFIFYKSQYTLTGTNINFMDILIHERNNTKIAEISSNAILISNPDEGLQLLVDIYYQDIDKIILHEKNFNPAFFDLKNGIAGEILQKYSNYKVRLAIVGEFSNYQSKSLQDFIFESNKQKQVNFTQSIEEALQRLSR